MVERPWAEYNEYGPCGRVGKKEEEKGVVCTLSQKGHGATDDEGKMIKDTIRPIPHTVHILAFGLYYIISTSFP